jgi:hypothetical protein
MIVCLVLTISAGLLTTRTSPNGLMTPPQEPEVIDLSIEVVPKPICHPTNCFPQFNDGDVFIDLGILGPMRYHLHSTVLSRVSSWFDQTLAQPIKELDNMVAARFTKRTGIRARYELSFNSDLNIFVLARSVSVVLISCVWIFYISQSRETFWGKCSCLLQAVTKIKHSEEISVSTPAVPSVTERPNPSNAAGNVLTNIEPTSNFNGNIEFNIRQQNTNIPLATSLPKSTQAVQTSTSATPGITAQCAEAQDNINNPLTSPTLPEVKIEEMQIKEEEGVSNSEVISIENHILGLQDPISTSDDRAATNQWPILTQENRVANNVTKEIPLTRRERQATTDNNPPEENHVTNQECQVTSPKAELLAAYKGLFRTFYGNPPKIDSNDINVALPQVEAIIRIAELYGSIPIVRPYLGNCLMQFGRIAYAAILQDPPRWIQLSLYLESAPLFREAAVHIIGNLGNWPWPTVQPSDFPDDLVGLDSLFQKKVDKLKGLMADVERTFFMSSINIEGEGGSLAPTGRGSINTWYVAQLWKEWFSRSVAKDEVSKRTRRSDGMKYRWIAKGGDAYLPLETVINHIKAFREPTRLTKADKQGIEEDLKMIKTYAQKYVGLLCFNKSMLSVEEAGIEHLTCVSVDNDEIPWTTKKDDSPVPNARDASEH